MSKQDGELIARLEAANQGLFHEVSVLRKRVYELEAQGSPSGLSSQASRILELWALGWALSDDAVLKHTDSNRRLVVDAVGNTLEVR